MFVSIFYVLFLFIYTLFRGVVFENFAKLEPRLVKVASERLGDVC
jgi:hypothetical protein